jgi:hypothetical protein
MQAIDFIELYVAVTFSLAAVVVVAESIALPLMDMIRRVTPAVQRRAAEATVHPMPKPAARKDYKEWDTMQLDVAA